MILSSCHPLFMCNQGQIELVGQFRPVDHGNVVKVGHAHRPLAGKTLCPIDIAYRCREGEAFTIAGGGGNLHPKADRDNRARRQCALPLDFAIVIGTGTHPTDQ